MDPVLDFMKTEQRTKAEKYVFLNEQAVKGQTLFTGSSLMEQFPINELLMNAGMDCIVYNRGIGGFTTDDMLQNMDAQIFGTEPSRIFINIGTNDISGPDYKVETLIGKYEQILTQIKERLPETKVYMMAYYPVNSVDKVPDNEWGKMMFAVRTNENIKIANQEVEKLAAKMGYTYIDVNDGLTDERGMLKKEYTVEGVHMYANGYKVIFENMKKYL